VCLDADWAAAPFGGVILVAKVTLSFGMRNHFYCFKKTNVVFNSNSTRFALNSV
jgi:hypothetical protein